MDALELDFYEERRRKWRRSAFWRGVLFTLVAIVAVMALLAWRGGPVGPHIAQFHILGEIFYDYDRDDILRQLRDDEDVRAVILRIDSPGGTAVGSEAIHDFVSQIAATKPVVAVMDEVAASGGYIAALGADHIIARSNTITGSIGVIMEYPDVTRLMDTLGIEMRTYRSSPAKADASPYRKPTPEGQAFGRAVTDDTYDWFRQLVADHRNLTGEGLSAVANGAIFTGRQALELGLIDQIGSQEQAVIWLESQDDTLLDLPIETWLMPEYDPGFWGWLAQTALNGEKMLGFLPTEGPRLKSVMR